MGERYSGERPWRRWRRVARVVSPAAAADWSVTVPAGKLWQILAIAATLTTDATVANRAATIELTDGTTTFARIPPAAVQAASLGVVYSWWETAAALSVGGVQSQPIPHLTLKPGWVLAAVTANLSAADQWSAIALELIETTVQAGPIDFEDVPELIVAMAGPSAT